MPYFIMNEKEKAILLQMYDKKHLRNLMTQKKVLDAIYEELAKEAAKIGKASGFDDPDAEFHFEDFPQTQKLIEKLLYQFVGKLETNIIEGNKREWMLAEEKNKKLITKLAKGTKIPKETLEGWTAPNLDALEAFQSRKTKGMGLSERVWNLSEQTKSELELALDIGLGEGKSAAALSRDVRSYLNEPKKLFRRVRDKHGNLRLSKAAAVYHPGQGVYRSSYKNALRMTATENNMAYRTSDHEKWGSLDFVIGQRVQLSNNHTLNGKPFTDICDAMEGKYPKDFKFTGWHPFCRCIVTPILADWDEQLKVMKMQMNGEDVSNYHYKGEITDVPAGYKKWMTDNAKRIASAKNMPYFIKDNYVGGKVENGFKWLDKANNIEPAEDVHMENEAVKAIRSAKTAEELANVMKDRKLVKVFDLEKMALDDQKAIAEAWVNIQETFELDAIDIRLKDLGKKNSNTFMWACGEFVEANTKYWSKDNIKATTSTSYKSCTDRRKVYEDRLKIKESKLKSLEETAKKDPRYSSWYEKEIKKLKKEIEQLKSQVESGLSRYNAFLSPETMLRDCFTHESGHTIHDQILGGINSRMRKSKYSIADAAVLNDELKKLFRKYKKTGGGYLSEYGYTDWQEFAAENTVLYMHAPDKMPADVRHWFDLLKEFAKTGKLPASTELPSAKFKEQKPKKKGNIINADSKDNESYSHKREQNRILNAPIIEETDKRNGRLSIDEYADNKDLTSNIGTAHVLLDNFKDMSIKIRTHVFSNDGVKNPEYEINGLLGDRKGIESVNGIRSAFQKAKKQHAKVVIIDLDEHKDKFKYIKENKIASAINARYNDFISGDIVECYIVRNGKSIRIDASFITDDIKHVKEALIKEINKLKG